MKKLIFMLLILSLTATAAERENKSAILTSQDRVSTGTRCSSGGLAFPVGIIGIGHGSAKCAEGFRRIYHVLIEGYDYTLEPDSQAPLAKVRPGDEVKYRLDDKNHLWTPDRHGRRVHVAKYLVMNIDPKQGPSSVQEASTSSAGTDSRAAQSKAAQQVPAGSLSLKSAAPAPLVTAPAAENRDNPAQSLPSTGTGILGVSGANWEQGGVKGVEILEVSQDSSAELAGLHTGDVITDIDGWYVRSTQDLASILAQIGPGTSVGIGYLVKTQLGWMPKETTAILAKKD